MANRYKCHAKNVCRVLRDLADFLDNKKGRSLDCDAASLRKQVAPLVEDLCNELQGYDMFGTEGACDPRGDQRD